MTKDDWIAVADEARRSIAMWSAIGSRQPRLSWLTTWCERRAVARLATALAAIEDGE